MSKWVEVPITIFKMYAVEIKDNESVEDAQRYATEDCMADNIEIGDCLVAKDEYMAESIKRHADKRLSM